MHNIFRLNLLNLEKVPLFFHYCSGLQYDCLLKFLNDQLSVNLIINFNEIKTIEF